MSRWLQWTTNGNNEAAVLHDHVPTADDLEENGQFLVDGTLLPCWSWKE